MNINVTSRSGKTVDLINPQTDQLDLSDIANSLARQNRFNGNLKENYTVLEHSMCGAHLFVMNGMYSHAITFLMHDAHEAYIGDISSPVKRFLRVHTTALQQLEDDFNKVIWQKFMPDQAVPFDDVYVKMLDKYIGEKEHTNCWDSIACNGDYDFEHVERIIRYSAWSPTNCWLTYYAAHPTWEATTQVEEFVRNTFDERQFNPTTKQLVEVFVEYYHQLLGQLMLEEIKARRNR